MQIIRGDLLLLGGELVSGWQSSIQGKLVFLECSSIYFVFRKKNTTSKGISDGLIILLKSM